MYCVYGAAVSPRGALTCEVCPPPPRLDPPTHASVGPNLSHHKVRVQAVGWPPVGSQETGQQARQNGWAPSPPPPQQQGLNLSRDHR